MRKRNANLLHPLAQAVVGVDALTTPAAGGQGAQTGITVDNRKGKKNDLWSGCSWTINTKKNHPCTTEKMGKNRCSASNQSEMHIQ
jgi:hypothetical protein